MHAQCAQAPSEDFQNFNTTDINNTPESITRAVNTVALNNMLVKGTIRIKGNLIIDGLITGTITRGDNPIFGPGSSTINAIARFNNTTGDLLSNSTILIDNLNNITAPPGIYTLTSQSFVTTQTLLLGKFFDNSGLTCIQGIDFQEINSAGSYVATTTTALVIFSTSGTISSFTVTFPPSPINGQFFTLINGSSDDINSLALITSDGSTIFTPVSSLTGTTLARCAITYQFYAPNNIWYQAIS